MKRVGREFMSAYSWSGKASANFAIPGVTMLNPRLKKYSTMTADRPALPIPTGCAPIGPPQSNLSWDILSMAFEMESYTPGTMDRPRPLVWHGM